MEEKILFGSILAIFAIRALSGTSEKRVTKTCEITYNTSNNLKEEYVTKKLRYSTDERLVRQVHEIIGEECPNSVCQTVTIKRDNKEYTLDVYRNDDYAKYDNPNQNRVYPFFTFFQR